MKVRALEMTVNPIHWSNCCNVHTNSHTCLPLLSDSFSVVLVFVSVTTQCGLYYCVVSCIKVIRYQLVWLSVSTLSLLL